MFKLKKIVLFNGNLELGGITEIIFGLASLLKKNGINYKITCLKIDKNSLKKAKEYNLNVEIIGNNRHYYSPLNLYSIYKHLKNCDIIHVHDFPSQLWIACLSIFFKNKTLILTEHSTKNNRRKYKFFKYIDKIIHSRYDKIVSITQQVEEELLRWYKKSKNKKYIVINNGIDLSKFSGRTLYRRKNFGIAEKDKVLVMVSRIDFNTKDYITLLKGIKNLNVKLLIVGDGDDKEKLIKIIEKEKLRDKVILLGKRNDVNEILPLCDIGILSSHFEGFGIAAVEMMACGLPIVVSDVDGLKQIVEGYGIIFKLGNEKDLENKIKMLLENSGIYNEVKEKCKKRALDFSLENCFARYIKIYNS